MTAKPIFIKDTGGKSGGRVSKAAELIAGELLHCHGFVTEGGVVAAISVVWLTTSRGKTAASGRALLISSAVGVIKSFSM